MESKFYEKDKLLIFKMTDEIDDHSVQKIRRKADYFTLFSNSKK